MSEFVSHTPEDLSKKPNLQDRVDKVADLVGNLMGTSNADEEAWIKRAGIFQQIQTEVGYGFRNAGDLLLVQDDDRKTEKQKELAKEAEELLVLGTAKALIGGSNEDKEAIGVGSIMKIKERLPEELNGLEKKVRDSIIDEPEIQKILDPLDIVRKRVAKAGETGQKVLEDQINKAQEKLILLEVDSTKEDQLGMVVEWLGEEGKIADGLHSRDQVFGREDPEVKEYLKAQAEYAERRNILEKDIEKVSLNEQIDAYLYVRAPRERAPQQWEYDVPEELKNIGFNPNDSRWEGLSGEKKRQMWERMSEEEKNRTDQESWRQLLNFMDRWLGAIYNKRANSEYNNSIEKMSQGILNMQSLPMVELKKWYENDVLNLSTVMQIITNELMVPETYRSQTTYYNKENNLVEGLVNRRRYVFKTTKEVDSESGESKISYSSGEVKEYIKNEDTYKSKLIERLVKSGKVKNRLCGKLSVAIAMNIMEMGGVLSAADTLRKLSWDSDAVRLAQRPETKFRAKVDKKIGELFAGPWAELANTLAPYRKTAPMQIVEEWGVIPKQLSGSFLDQKINKDDPKTIMDSIYQGDKVNFENTDSDMFFGWRKDHIMPAARLWMYISNKQTLEFSKNRESDSVISAWRTDLYNDVHTLRANEDSIVDTRILAGAIGGSVGLWMFEGPYLRIGSGGGMHRDAAVDYSEFVTEIIKQLGVGKAEESVLLKSFGVDRANFRDIREKLVSYKSIRNVTAPNWIKKKDEKILFRKRPVS